MAKEMLDIMLDENEDLLFKDGDFVIGDATLQHQRHLLKCEKGNIKSEPLTGVGIRNFLLDDEVNAPELKKEIQREFEADGMKIRKLKINELSNCEIEADYEDDIN